MPKRRIEIFTGDCPICELTVDLVNNLACPSCEVIIRTLSKNTGKETQNKADSYGIKRVPAVAVDGKLLGCCEMSSVSEASLRKAGVGSP